MSDVLEFHISCPQCNYSNIATTSIAKYKEVVYQPCNDNEGQQDHNMKDQIRCDNCHQQVLTSTGVLDTRLVKTMQRIVETTHKDVKSDYLHFHKCYK